MCDGREIFLGRQRNMQINTQKKEYGLITSLERLQNLLAGAC